MATAYHEAGHAFAGWHFRFKVKKASIISNSKNKSAGYVKTVTGLHLSSLDYSNPSSQRIGRLHERAVYLMVGPAAQRRFRSRSVRFYHGGRDREMAFYQLERIHPPNEIPHVWRYLEAKAKNLVDHPMHWRVISNLAESLLKQQSMTGDQVEVVIREGYKTDFQSSITRHDQGRRPIKVGQLPAAHENHFPMSRSARQGRRCAGMYPRRRTNFCQSASDPR